MHSIVFSRSQPTKPQEMLQIKQHNLTNEVLEASSGGRAACNTICKFFDSPIKRLNMS